MATIPDKVNTGALATIVAVGAISMVGISAALTAMVRSEVDSHAEAVGAKSNLGPVRELKKTWLDELNQPARRDPATGRAMIPVERAMELVVQDLRQHPEHATEPPPPDAGKHESDAGAAPAAADGAPTGEADAGAAPAPEAPAPGHEAPAPGHEAPAPGHEAPPAPAPEPPTGAAPPSGEHNAVPSSPSPAPAKKKKPAAHAPAPPPAAPPNSP